ncbi:PKD domain-containing protein, partial [Bacteroidota bacterium]
ASTVQYITISGGASLGDLVSVEVRVKLAGTWSASSNELWTFFYEFWPVRNASGNATKGLLHNFCQPIEVSSKTYLHEGVDINGDFNVASELVVASHSSLLSYMGGASPGLHVNLQYITSTAYPYVQYNHLKNLHASLVIGKSIVAGDTIGKIDDAVGSWNTQCFHTHMHHWTDNANMVGSTKNPFLAFSDNDDRDPFENNPDMMNTNADTKAFRIRKAASSTYLPDNYIAYNAVDFVVEATDRMSSGGFYQIPKSIGYYIKKKEGATFVNSVKDSASPYLLYDNINWLASSFGFISSDLRAGLIDSATSLKGSPPVTPSTYVFNQYFTWIVTNAKGTDGTTANIDKNQCWATNARNTVTEANGYNSSYSAARAVDEAKFPDGEYKVYVPLTDFKHSITENQDVKVDNFKPYVDVVVIWSGNTKIYEAEWQWDSASAILEFIDNTIALKASCGDDVDVTIICSEPMNEVTLSVPTLQFSQTKTSATNSYKLAFYFTIPSSQFSNATQSKITLNLSGKDICNNPIHGFLNTNDLAAANIPKRQPDGTWLPATASQADKVHFFELDTFDVEVMPYDATCYGKRDGIAIANPLGGTTPYTYLWTPTGQTGKVASGLRARNYSVTVTDKFGCIGIGDTLINQPEKIQVSIVGGPAIIPFCIQDGQPSVTLTASASGGTPPYSYSWPNHTLIVAESGFYTVTVTDSKGCMVDATTFIWFINILCSRDPNDITGPGGYGAEKFISKTDYAPYIIRFENDPDFASAPAQKVVVTCPFDPNLNMYSFRLGEFGFGDFDIQIPAGKTFYTTRVDVKDSLHVYVDVIAGIDATNNEAFWIFESIDPNSGLAPTDPNKGFLLINDSVTHRGEGYVSYIVLPDASTSTGDSIKAKGKIVFDVNPPIYTNEWANTMDVVPPTSKVDSLPTHIDSTSFVVSWSGYDDTEGSGVATYDLYVSANNQAFVLYQKDMTDTALVFNGVYGVLYKFYTRAKDHVGNKEGAKTIADASISILPERFFNKPDSATVHCKSSPLVITWKQKDIYYINLEYSKDSGQTYHLIADGLDVTNGSYTWQIPDSLPGNRYYHIQAINAETSSSFNLTDYFYLSDLPTVDAGTDKNICYGSAVTIGGSPTAGGSSSPYTYAWTNPSSLSDDSISNPLANPLSDTRYHVTVTDSLGCSAVDSVDVFVHSMPVVSFSINDSSQCAVGNSYTYINSSSVSSGSYTIAWNLGDNTTSGNDTVNHSYSGSGNYLVKLIATSDQGCMDSSSSYSYVRPMPSASFSINDSDQCLTANSYGFSNSSSISSGTLTYYWTFGDSDTSTALSPSKTYAGDGTFAVKLLVSSDYTCQDSFLSQVVVYPQPVAGFTVNDSTQCLSGNTFSFTNSSSVSSGTFTSSWDFGDTDTSTSSSPAKTYQAASTYQVKLLISSNQGCMDSSLGNVYVFPEPTVSFTVNDTDQCQAGNNFSFTNSSSVSTGTLTHYWSFGNGSSSTLQNPGTSYTADGSYLVKLVETSDQSCVDSSQAYVHVRPMPVANFGYNIMEACLGQASFNFYDSSTISSGSLSYSWNFDDGNSANSQNPSHTYSSSDTFHVKLVVTSNYQCPDSSYRDMLVHPLPQASFSVSDTSLCLVGNQFNFTNLSSIASGSVSYLWNFGDNSTSTQTSPAKSYSTAGTYQVKLLVTSALGCMDSFTRTLYVNPGPVAGFSVNDSTQCLNLNSFAFNNTSTISSGNLNYTWNFGDNTSSQISQPSHTYLNAGTYSVKLIATSDFACSDSVNQMVYVYPDPAAAFTVNNNSQCLGSNYFLFTDSSTISSGTLSQYWDFGDLNTSTATNPNHTYSSVGLFTVSLISTSDMGCSDTSSSQVSVYPSPQATFSVNDSDQCLSVNSFQFTNLSSTTQGTINYYWEFGNGDTSTAKDPSYSYSTADTFHVMLVAYSTSGCGDTTYQDMIVHSSPVSDFNINDNDQCFNYNHFVLTNTSLPSATTLTHLWDFGDGYTSNATHISHIYLSTDTFTIKLVSNSPEGCMDSISKQVFIHPSPVVDFAIDDAVQCQNTNIFSFTNNSTISGDTLTYSWRFGDTTQSVLKDPTHMYMYEGIFAVRLSALTSLACADTIVKNVYVLPAPQVDFSVNDSAQCLNSNVFAFSNQSSVTSGNLAYRWAFVSDTDTNSMNFSNLKNPTHSYASTGYYTVKLKAVSDSSCSDSAYHVVYVKSQPSIHFSVYNACLGDSNKFTDYSVVDTPATISNWKWYFGDGNTSSQQTVAHVYAATGTYTVSLKVGTDESCFDSIGTSVEVFELPKEGFSISYGANGDASFTSVEGSGSTFKWHFGDGDSSSQYNPLHKYNANGKFVVKMVVTNSNGCVSTTIDTAIISNSLSEEELSAERFRLKIYPNPFRAQTNIVFDLNSSSSVKLSVYDMYGQEIKVLDEGTLRPGKHFYNFGENENLAGGVYLIKLQVNGKIYVDRVVKVLLPY